MSRLLPCPSCHRHVKIADLHCPFCQAAMPATVIAPAQAAVPLGRLSRIAVLAAGATLLTASAAGCDDDAKSTDGGVTARDGAATGGATGTGGSAGGGGSSAPGTGGATVDGGQPEVPIAIYAAAVALPRNRG